MQGQLDFVENLTFGQYMAAEAALTLVTLAPLDYSAFGRWGPKANG